MRVVLQRVTEASVRVDGTAIARIESGVVLLVGLLRGDTDDVAKAMALKIAKLRIFEDADGRTNCGFEGSAQAVLAISQFTLAADTSRGRRPSFEQALEPRAAAALFESFVQALESALARPVAKGAFGASMQVALVNDGPFTLVLEQIPAGM
jgi:D-tyrosyl-tRNA(Tyr) deacylase